MRAQAAAAAGGGSGNGWGRNQLHAALANPATRMRSHPDYATRYAQDVEEALRRLPADVIVARNQRLKRAMDLSLKHEKLPAELRELQTPFEHYLLVRVVGRAACMPGALLHAAIVRAHCHSADRNPLTALLTLCTETLLRHPMPPYLPAAHAPRGPGRAPGARAARQQHALSAHHPLNSVSLTPPLGAAALCAIRGGAQWRCFLA